MWHVGNGDIDHWLLYAYIPRHNALNNVDKRDASHAAYYVQDITGKWKLLSTLDQERYADEWVFLGVAALDKSADVMLTDNVAAPEDPPSWVVSDVGLFQTRRGLPRRCAN